MCALFIYLFIFYYLFIYLFTYLFTNLFIYVFFPPHFRLGLLQVAAVNTAMSALIKATTSFVTEKLIVQRERRSGAYSVVPYFFSKLAAEMPLSAFFPCMTGFLIYKLCGLNPAPGRLWKFLTILTVESFAATGKLLVLNKTIVSSLSIFRSAALNSLVCQADINRKHSYAPLSLCFFFVGLCTT
jgi:hypothetical protein